VAGYGLDSCGLDGYRLDGGGLKDLTALPVACLPCLEVIAVKLRSISIYLKSFISLFTPS